MWLFVRIFFKFFLRIVEVNLKICIHNYQVYAAISDNYATLVFTQLLNKGPLLWPCAQHDTKCLFVTYNLDVGNVKQNMVGHANDYQFVAMTSGGSGKVANQCNVFRENLTLDIGSIV
jgi:hypothetical protein